MPCRRATLPLPLVGCPHSLVYFHLPVVEGLIFCISATPHLETSFPLFHGPKCSARSTSRQQQVIGLRQRIITSPHKNRLTFISVSTIFIIRPRSLYSQIYLLLLWSRVTILHLRSFIHCQCWQESNERMHSSTTWPRLNAVVMKRFQDAAGGGLSLVTSHQSPLLFTIIQCGLWSWRDYIWRHKLD